MLPRPQSATEHPVWTLMVVWARMWGHFVGTAISLSKHLVWTLLCPKGVFMDTSLLARGGCPHTLYGHKGAFMDTYVRTCERRLG